MKPALLLSHPLPPFPNRPRKGAAQLKRKQRTPEERAIAANRPRKGAAQLKPAAENAIRRPR